MYQDKRKKSLGTRLMIAQDRSQDTYNHQLQTKDLLDITTHCYNYLHMIRLAMQVYPEGI